MFEKTAFRLRRISQRSRGEPAWTLISVLIGYVFPQPRSDSIGFARHLRRQTRRLLPSSRRERERPGKISWPLPLNLMIIGIFTEPLTCNLATRIDLRRQVARLGVAIFTSARCGLFRPKRAAADIDVEVCS